MVGRKEAPGRPLLYGTTKDFLEVFGLHDLTGLPTLRELGDGAAEILTAPDLTVTDAGVVETPPPGEGE
jgi:segregation and condensation protein B